jgi:hypothetical protein
MICFHEKKEDIQLDQMQLRQAVEERKEYLKNELMKLDFFKTPEGKQLYELNLSELERLHINLKCDKGR